MSDPTEASEPARRALRKCAMRLPGMGVHLTDDEVIGLFDWLTAMGRRDVLDYIEQVDVVVADATRKGGE